MAMASMMDRLKAEESLASIADMQVGGGHLKQDAANRVLRGLRKRAYPEAKRFGPPQSAKSIAQSFAMGGIGVRMVSRG